MIYAVNKWTKEHIVVKTDGSIPSLCDITMEWRTVEADADGWIEWSGGECPLLDGHRVAVKYQDGRIENFAYSDSYRWRHGLGSINIVAYKPILEPQAERVKEWRGPEDGLPPVGTVCEVYIANRDAWTETEVKAHADGLALFKNGTGGHFYGRTAEHYRPIRTDRKRWVAGAEHAIEDATGEPAQSSHLAIIYDALASGELDPPARN